MQRLTLIQDATKTSLPAPIVKATSRNGQREATLVAWSEDGAQAGTWECGPGEFTTVRSGFHEVCQILSGSGALISDEGDTAELCPGSTVVIPDGWSGVWRIDETMRKTFVMVSVPSS